MDATIPITLNDPRFLAKWQEYVEYRRERHLSKLVSRSVQKQWDRLSEYDLETVLAAIDLTIANGWQGLFPERVGAGQRPLGVSAGTASLGALQIELQRKREELSDLTNPGGAAFPAPLTGQKFERASLLREQIKAIKANIDRISTRT